MSTELKPCPFCGNAGNRDPRHTFWIDEHRRLVAVRCGSCGAKGPWVRHTDGCGEDSEGASLHQWNRRAFSKSRALEVLDAAPQPQAASALAAPQAVQPEPPTEATQGEKS